MKKQNRYLTMGIFGVLLTSLLWMGFGYFFTMAQLRMAEQKGLFASPDEGFQVLVVEGVQGFSKIEEYHSGYAYGDRLPHVQYAAGRLYATHWKDGTPFAKSSYYPSIFFVKTKQGWLNLPEHGLPGFTGAWMKFYGLAGEVE